LLYSSGGADFIGSFRFFFAYLVVEAIEAFALYGMDVLPWVSGETWWRTFCVGLVIEGFIRFAVMGELFLHLLRTRPAIAKVGSRLISGTGAALVLIATLAAAYAPVDSQQFAIGYRAHLLQTDAVYDRVRPYFVPLRVRRLL